MPLYNLIEYNSNYSETSRSLWCYSKYEGTNFNNNIANTNNFKYFKYKTELLENTEADEDNGILKNATIAVSLKHLSNFWRSLKMPSVNCKVELKYKWTKYYVLSAAGNDNTNVNPNSIIFTMRSTKLYVPVVTLPASDNQKLSKLLSKGFERSVYWNKYKTKSENKNTTNEFGCFLESNFVGVNRLLVLVYPDQNNYP